MPDQVDRAITSTGQDLLGRNQLVDRLTRALVDILPGTGAQSRSIHATGHVIGLTGEWGSGKSSVLNLLAAHLGTLERVVVVNFNPWLFRSHTDLLDGFFNELAAQLGKSTTEELRDLFQTIDKYRGAVAAGAGTIMNAVIPGASIGIGALNAMFPRPRIASAVESRAALEEKLAKLNVAVVVLVDELDRVEDEEVRAVARLVKAVGEISGISYLVAYDPKRVIDALGRGTGDDRKRSGESYLEKIIQLVVPLRPLLDYEIESMLRTALKMRGYSSLGENTEREAQIIDILRKSFSTPRDVKRLVGNFAAIEPMIRGEVNLLDVLGYCYLLVKAPSIRDAIALNLDSVVDDPAEQEMMARALKKKTVTIDSTFGQLAEKHEQILKWLFPAFGGKRDGTFDRDQIRKRRNLVRLLYLGNPPHDVPRTEVENVWNCDKAGAERSLLTLIENDRLRSFIDRFRDLLPWLPMERDSIFWTALARSLVRQQDWISAPESQRAVVNDLDDTLRTLGATDGPDRDRARKIVDALIADGDLVILPSLLRSHVFRYGLTAAGDPPRSHISAIYNEAEVNALIQKETPRYRTAIEQGVQLRRLPDVDLIFLLLNLGLYDRALRANVSNQLVSPEALATFACLIIPPGYLIERTTMDELIDASAVANRLDQLVASGAFSGAHQWISDSIQRLKKVLDGESLY